MWNVTGFTCFLCKEMTVTCKVPLLLCKTLKSWNQNIRNIKNSEYCLPTNQCYLSQTQPFHCHFKCQSFFTTLSLFYAYHASLTVPTTQQKIHWCRKMQKLLLFYHCQKLIAAPFCQWTVEYVIFLSHFCPICSFLLWKYKEE